MRTAGFLPLPAPQPSTTLTSLPLLLAPRSPRPQGYTEVRYSEEKKRVIYEPLQLTQAFRNFESSSPWEQLGPGVGQRPEVRLLFLPVTSRQRRFGRTDAMGG